VQWRVVGRLRPGATVERAQGDAEQVAAEIRRTNAISNTAGQYIRIEPMKKNLVSSVQPTIVALMGAVVFLLLIACANIANLLLVRMSLRERELAVRAAIGGGAWDLVRQVLAESLLLAGTGAALGIALAWAGVRELLAIAPESLPRLDAVRIDTPVLAFTALAGLGSAAIFGLVPVLRAARPDLMHVLRGTSRNTGLARSGIMRSAVVVAEVALCFVLLTGSGLMIRTFIALRHVQPGFDTHDLLTFQLLRGGQPVNNPAQRAAFLRQLHDGLASLPGVESVTSSFPFPLTGNFSPIRWGTAEAQADPSKFQATDFQFVLPGYFQTLHTRILEGREFTDADNQPGRKLVVIDQNLAAKAFPGRSAVGQRILTRITTPQAEWVEVIGVAEHQRTTELGVAGREQIYFPDAFIGGVVNRWALRTSGDPARYAAAVRDVVRKQGNNLLVTELQPMDQWVERSLAGTRFSLLLIGMFAVIAAVLAAVGLYGVLSTVVRQRTAEIGVRMALGAAPGGIFGLVVGYGLRLSAAGVGAGLLAAFGATRVMASMLVGVKPTDPVTFAAMAGVFAAIAAAASWLPARRAARLDPTQALREE
jgi:putative ABC transport system permease protein